MKRGSATFSTLLLAVLLAGATTIFAGTMQSASIARDHVVAKLIADRATIAPGDTFTIALEMKLEDHWHVYWTNPGDAGLPPRINWQLPEGLTAQPLEFPIPERIPAGPLMSFGYNHEPLFLTQIVVSSQLQPGQTLDIVAEVDWLICKVECIPGEAVFSLRLLVSGRSEIDENARTRFQAIRAVAPIKSDSWSLTAEQTAKEITLVGRKSVAAAEMPEELVFFPHRKGLIENAGQQVLTLTDDGFSLRVPRNTLNTDTLREISGLLVSDSDWLGNGHRALEFAATIAPPQPAPIVAATSDINLWQALLFAVLGGMILNLMPCVLPVLSIKILGVVQQANESRRSIAGHNVMFTLGVLVSFWILAILLQVLKAGGEHLGWGFQLQSPAFIIGLAAFMFLIGLNLFGVFEVGTSLTGIGSSKKTGALGSFIAGMTATIVATPCTAPFMGAALGFSLAQPPYVSLLVFTALGVGMAAPYVIITSTPGLLRFVPKPGRWMETLKQAMGFLLMATVVWLAWVLGVQAGADAVVLLLGGLLIVGIAAWILGRWGGLAGELRSRMFARATAACLIVGALTAVVLNLPATGVAQVPTGNSDGIQWEPFSPQRVVQLQQEGRPLIIDFTAAWCLSCKVNERVAFGSADVRKRIDELNVATLRADWTSRDATITQALAEFGRNSVPLYVMYSGRKGGAPVVLPELLTPGIVLEALDKLEG